MEIELNKKEKEDLFFILYEFINTHDYKNNCYANEIKIAEKIIKKLKRLPPCK